MDIDEVVLTREWSKKGGCRAKKCTKCGVPLEGFFYKIASKLFGVKPSVKDPGICNKCEDKPEKKSCGCCH